MISPIRCPLNNNGCRNSEIPFSEFIQHLKIRHEVASSVTGYETKDNRLVTYGSSKFFIMDGIFGQQFLVTTEEINGCVYVWVSLHGTPEAAKGFKAEMKLLGGRGFFNGIWNGSLSATTRNTSATDLLRFSNSQRTLDLEPQSFFRIPEAEVRQNMSRGVWGSCTLGFKEI